MAFDLARVLRSLLFASPGSLSAKEIQAVFTRFHEEAAAQRAPDDSDAAAAADGDAQPATPADGQLTAADVPSLVTATQIRESMEAISRQLEAGNEVFRLQETHHGWRLVTSPDCADWVRLLRNQPKPMRLSQSAMETLAIVAYRQPVVRAEVESIRGVSVDSAINRLLERELIHIVGRADLPGRPIQYGTTDNFLEFVGIKSLDELPASDVLGAREIDVWLRRREAQHPIADQDVGLDTESGDETADLDWSPEAAERPGEAGSSQGNGEGGGLAGPGPEAGTEADPGPPGEPDESRRERSSEAKP